VASRVEVLVGSALELTQSLISADVEPFDLVFIDADKPNNPVYLEAAMKMTRPGAVIIFDNVVRDGKVTDPAAEDLSVQGVRTVTDIIAATPNLGATAIQTVGVKGWDGFILARRTDSPSGNTTPRA
jgi:predicted O-methyltransferase YrrM